MHTSFDNLVNSFIKNKIGIDDNFLSEQLSKKLIGNITRLKNDKELFSAGTGNAAAALQNRSFRGDIIHWLDRSNNNKYENEFFDLMDAFVLFLNNSCYTGIKSYEFHYTLYEEGTFYKKHLDQFRNNDSRQYSMVIYLNNNWQSTDGGELRVYPDDKIENISPQNRKAVFFKSSDLEHEVLITHKPRMSITGWLKK